MTARIWVALAGAGSAALLAGAFAFQYIGGLAPCTLCLWQRWPHGAAIIIALLALVIPRATRPLAGLGALAALATAGIGAFHVGVEYGWWEGLATCSAGSISGISASDLLSTTTDVGAPVPCDQVAWSMAGISMAGWNAILSLGFAALWVKGALSR